MASKKKIIGSGVDVQTAAGVSALTVDETTGAVTVGPSSGTDGVFHQTIGYQANSWIQGFLNRYSANTCGIYCGGTDGKWSGYGHADGHAFGAWNGSAFITVGSCTQAGSWTWGKSSGNLTHTINGGILVGGAAGASTNSRVSSKDVELADDAISTISADNTIGVVRLMIVTNSGSTVDFLLQGGLNTTVIVVDPQSVGANSDTDGKICVYYSSGYKLKNRTGATVRFSIFAFGGSYNI